ncbi:MAG: penicillin-binding protein [Nocardioides sp.]|jgi:cell division protein FtsI/penicillin-binding protein 2|uniref:penicillin-binding transpeptidase domain-containing protein n=1 Tax=Nocardioides sp. TaxID=35761 RepID=UPI002637C271|nr:penicillin-binding transpeptidase domain-containing protein [Nocardioides sp.]MCW2834836.1 penicillin-binding protein [Nocardioides sp.]
MRSRLAAPVLAPVLATVLAAPLALTGCQLLGDDEGPGATLAALQDGLTSGDLSAVAFTSADPTDDYTVVVEGLGEVEPDVEVGDAEVADDTASAEVSWTWDLDGESWTYATSADLTRVEDTWQVAWAPSLVEPSLVEGERLALQRTSAERGRITGAGDRAIVAPRDVVLLGLDKTKLTADQVADGQVAISAQAIAEALKVDAAAYTEQAEAAGEKAFVQALVLRAEEATTLVPPRYAEIPGAVSLATQQDLAPSRGFAAPILGSVGEATAELIEESAGEVEAGDVVGLSGLQARYDDQLAGTPGLTVIAAGADNDRAVHEVPAVAGADLRTTLDIDLQTKAESALASVGPPSAVVAIRPSDGAILAAASGPGSKGLNTATYGQYAPGSTFKVVSSLALLRTGLRPEGPVQCPASTVVDGKTFKNYDDYPASGLGTITLRQAVANSCNTAFITARDRLRDGDLAEAAAALGSGVDHDLGFPAYFGQVPAPEGETEAAADLIGQGKVLASPMTMATVAASVAAGRAVLPVLLPDHEVTQTAPAAPLTPAEAGDLRALMRAVVTEGSASFLADLPGEVGAKTGTAEYGSPDASGSLPTHTWMIATQGDLAVAVFVETGESGSRTAGPVLERFLS